MRLHTETWGTGDRTALLVHGITSAAATWWEIAEGLAEAGWTVTAVDLRGHGLSPRGERYLLEDLVADVLAVAPRFDLVVGHSLGGPVLVTALARQPDFAERLVLVDPALRRDEDPAFVEATLASLELTDPAFWREQEPGWAEQTVLARVAALAQADAAAMRSIIESNVPWDVTADAVGLLVPTHVIAADPELGAAFSAGYGAELASVTPLWTYEVVAGAGHSVHRDRPDVVLARLLR